MIERGPRPTSNFYVLDKRISEDRRLSWAARGLLIFLLGKPDHWRVSVTALINETAGSGKRSGRDAVWGLLAELVGAGYCVRSQSRNADGTLADMDYVVREEPCTENPCADEPLTAKPCTAEPCTANPDAVVNTDVKQILKKQQTPSSPPAGDGVADDGFDRFWKAYPRHQAKAAAAKSWKRLNAEQRKRAIAALPGYVASAQWHRDGGQFIPHASTWLNQERFDESPGMAEADRPLTRDERLQDVADQMYRRGKYAERNDELRERDITLESERIA